VTVGKSEDYHALLSPSSAHTWLLCEQSIALGMKEPNESSAFADEGTDAHTLGSLALESGLDCADYLGRKLPKGHVVDSERAEYVQIYVDLVRSKVKVYEAAGYIVMLEVEQRVPIGHITGEEGAEGTSDTVIIAEKADEAFIEVIDLKYGRGVQVGAVDNPQLKLYGLGALEKFALYADFETVYLTISQPRVSEFASEWAINREDLENWGETYVTPRALLAIEHTQARIPLTLALFNPGEDQCRFCKGRAICPALAKLTEDVCQTKFENMDALSPESAQALSVERLAEIYPALPLIDLFAKAVLGKIEALVLAGQQVTGAKVVKGRKGNRKWVSPEEAEATLKSMRLKHDEIYDYKLASPATIEKVLKEFPRKWKKAAALITQAEGNNTVVPESDPRPAVIIGPIADQFEEISDLE
jgi:hypothetical protein